MQTSHRRRLGWLLAVGLLLGLAAPTAGLAQSAPGKQDAVTMVKAAAAALKAGGPEATYAEINNPAGKYIKGDLYLVAYDMTGKVLAHGFNKSLIGRDLSKAKDPDGKAYVQERLDLARTEKSFWQSYKYLDPASRSLRAKDSYCERAADVIICGGVYH